MGCANLVTLPSQSKQWVEIRQRQETGPKSWPCLPPGQRGCADSGLSPVDSPLLRKTHLGPRGSALLLTGSTALSELLPFSVLRFPPCTSVRITRELHALGFPSAPQCRLLAVLYQPSAGITLRSSHVSCYVLFTANLQGRY